MIENFGTLINEVIRGLGLDSGTIETRTQDSIKLRINEAQDAIFYDQDWEWRKQTYYLTTRIPYETGTIAVTQNSKVVTGTATAWPTTLRVGYLMINSKIYKIQSIVSGTSLKLETPYDEDTLSGLTYKIIFPDYPLNHEISSIVAVRNYGNEIWPKTKQRLQIGILSLGLPQECAMSDRTNEDYYNTGVVTMTEASSAVVGVGTSWTSEMEGMTFRVNEFAKEYTIKSVDSTTTITLKETYDGDSGSGKGYKVNPKGTQLLTFRSTPNDYYTIEIEALVKPVKLVNNNDISLIPNHMPLVRYAVWLAMIDLEGKNPVRIQQAEADAMRTLKQLKDSYRVITNVQWRSDKETQVRNGFDPLSRRMWGWR